MTLRLKYFTESENHQATVTCPDVQKIITESQSLRIDVMKSEAVVDPALLTPEDSPIAQKEKKGSLQTFTDLRRAFAWELARWPLAKHVVWERCRIHLPRSYLSRDGEDVLTVQPGTDLNNFVHQYYLEEVDAKENTWVNYVHSDKVVAKRHEFLGPSPRVAGYFVDVDGDIYIKWWDSFLSDQWMGSQKWQVEVTWNGEKWIEKA
ncbi:hypothetical protein H0H81_011712 [Sphagnurus paluster]|uniref:Uncharacterized protein n=1 Tax=Sphagnurus paluster TaxID=117069 RepID=A0A9P7KI78_9AGAR|nr:hypothetical protein H0H81_011712 [Sphagnurus paluster]